MSATIANWRDRIDEVDTELLRLLNKRAELAIEIGALKRSTEAPLWDPQRERQVLLRARRANSGPLDEEAVARIFQCIMDESRRAEELLTEVSV
jgi:chorismate mutase-like protein